MTFDDLFAGPYNADVAWFGMLGLLDDGLVVEIDYSQFNQPEVIFFNRNGDKKQQKRNPRELADKADAAPRKTPWDLVEERSICDLIEENWKKEMMQKYHSRKEAYEIMLKNCFGKEIGKYTPLLDKLYLDEINGLITRGYFPLSNDLEYVKYLKKATQNHQNKVF